MVKARFLAGAALGSMVLGACSVDTPDPGEAIGQAQAAVSAPAPHLRGMARFRGGVQTEANPVCASPQLAYFGGPVLMSPKIVAVFWTSAVNATLQANIGQFYADVTTSSYWSWLHEYDTVGLSGGTNQGLLPGSSAGNFVIAPQVCGTGAKNCKLTDAQLQTELARQIGLGVLPAPSFDCTGNVDTLYMVNFPPNISLTAPGGGPPVRSCTNGGFCGYHFTGTYGPNNVPLVYAALMDVFTGPCAMGCGANAAPLDNATDLQSHEIAEAATDADIGLDMQNDYAAPGAWGDNDNNCGEIADICDDGSAGDTITVSGRKWVVQQLWSNQQGKCTSTGPAQAVCSGTTVTGCRKCSCGDDGLSCNGATSVCETNSGNVLFAACEQCTATGATCAGPATCQQSSTPSQDDICATCTPINKCPAGDTCGSVPDACGGTLFCGTCPSTEICSGNTCVPLIADAGTDSGASSSVTSTSATTSSGFGGFGGGSVTSTTTSGGVGGFGGNATSPTASTGIGGFGGGSATSTTTSSGFGGFGGGSATSTTSSTGTGTTTSSTGTGTTTSSTGTGTTTSSTGTGTTTSSTGTGTTTSSTGTGTTTSSTGTGTTTSSTGTGTTSSSTGTSTTSTTSSSTGSTTAVSSSSTGTTVATSSGSGTSTSSGGLGGAGGASSSASGGGASGDDDLLYGRATCACNTPGEAPSPSAAFLGLLGLAGLGARRRRPCHGDRNRGASRP